MNPPATEDGTLSSMERLAELVAERVLDGIESRLELHSAPKRVLTPADVAAEYPWSLDFIYAYADDLGARRVGNGPRPRILFYRETLEARLAAQDPPPEPPPASRPRRKRRDDVELVPIKGRRAA